MPAGNFFASGRGRGRGRERRETAEGERTNSIGAGGRRPPTHVTPQKRTHRERGVPSGPPSSSTFRRARCGFPQYPLRTNHEKTEQSRGSFALLQNRACTGTGRHFPGPSQHMDTVNGRQPTRGVGFPEGAVLKSWSILVWR